MIQSTQDQSYTKIHNTLVALDIIRQRRPVSRVDIVRDTGMSAASITRIVSDLIEAGVVCETTPFSNTVGRKAILLDVVTESVLCLGVNITPSALQVGVVDFKGNLLTYRSRALLCRAYSPARYADLVARECRQLQSELPAGQQVSCMGVTVIGIVDKQTNSVRFAPQLGWLDVPIAALLEERLCLPCIAANDVDAEIVGEAHSFSPDAHSVAYLAVGEGVGSSLLVDGQVCQGQGDICGEIGHTLIELGGMLCSCGRRGCLQTFIGERFVVRRAQKYDASIREFMQIFSAAQNGVSWAAQLMEDTATYLAVAINNLACMHSPQVLILGGALIRTCPMLFKMAQQKLDALLYEPLKGNFSLICSGTQGRSGMLGIAQTAQNRYVSARVEQSIL